MSLIALWSLARRFWPVLAALAVLLALFAWGNHREAQGVKKERASWEQEAARLREVAASEALARAAAVTAAYDADTQRNAALARLLAPINDKVNGYANTEPGRAVCPSADGRMLAQQAIDAANADIATAASARR